MKILLVNVDSRWNMAIRKLYNYYHLTNDVKMIDLNLSAYPHNKTIKINAKEYDEVFVSNIFEINKDKVFIEGCDNIHWGGIGSINPALQLPKEIEETEPYYFEYEDTSYGFITRGCIRNCYFCKVPRYEGKLKAYNKIENIVKHKKFVSLDNNIFAYDKCIDVFKWLYERNIRCDFNQGLDFRLANNDNMYWLTKLSYLKSEYIFAFDDIKYINMLNSKIDLLKKYIPKDWKIKFYIYVHPSMDIKDTIKRVEWCREHKCLPFIMKDFSCNTSLYKEFYTDYAGYCNMPSFFKNITFQDFLEKRYHYKKYNNPERIIRVLKIYEEEQNNK